MTPIPPAILPEKLRELRNAVSATRWDSYSATPAATSPEPNLDTAATYAWNVGLSEALYPVLNAVEVTLRNRVYDAGLQGGLPTRQGAICWLDTPGNLLKPEFDRVIAARTELIRDLARKYPTRTLRRRHRTAGRFVAKLTFGFWSYLFGSTYASGPTKTGLLWPNLLPAVFPSLPTGMQLAAIEGRIKAIRLLRNRVFHHEPVWNNGSLQVEYQAAMDVLQWLSPEQHIVMRRWSHFPDVAKLAVRRWLRVELMRP